MACRPHVGSSSASWMFVASSVIERSGSRRVASIERLDPFRHHLLGCFHSLVSPPGFLAALSYSRRNSSAFFAMSRLRAEFVPGFIGHSHHHAAIKTNTIPITATFQIAERTLGNPAV
jgi:hypothetical protein